jgi:predicted ATP-grasp superfamily ATP-dependent carboligase
MRYEVPAVILSGGSEIVSLALAEALVPLRIPLVVISLGQRSLVRDVQSGMVYREIAWPPLSVESTLGELIRILEGIHAGQPCPWPVFATEDGGLRLLMEGFDRLSPFLAIPGAKKLTMGGFDKAETFQYLSQQALDHLIAPTYVVSEPLQVLPILKNAWSDAIIKPSIKGFSMESPFIRSKIASRRPNETDQALLARLGSVWSYSREWIVQKRLDLSRGEANWWGIRTRNGKIIGATAREVWRQPRFGGTSCWVRLEYIPELVSSAERIMAQLDFQGIAELSFLPDDKGTWRLLEVNPRPWLQVALATRAGHPFVHAAYLDLIGESMAEPPPVGPAKSWVNAERVMLSAISGAYGPRFMSLSRGLRAIVESDCIAVYDTKLPRVRPRWVCRMARRAWFALLSARKQNTGQREER